MRRNSRLTAQPRTKPVRFASHTSTTPAVENGLMKQMKTKGSDTEANEPRHGLKKGKDGKKQSKAMKEI